MAVKLTKEPFMREYTPIHLIDEEDTISKTNVKVVKPLEAERNISIEVVDEKANIEVYNKAEVSKLKEIENTMTLLINQIQDVQNPMQYKICKKVFREIKKIKKESKKFNNEEKIEKCRAIISSVIGLILCALVVFNKNNIIAWTNMGRYGEFFTNMFNAFCIVSMGLIAISLFRKVLKWLYII